MHTHQYPFRISNTYINIFMYYVLASYPKHRHIASFIIQNTLTHLHSKYNV